MIAPGDLRFCTSHTLKLLSVSNFAADTIVCLSGSYSPRSLGATVRPQKDRFAERALKARLDAARVDHPVHALACWRESDGDGDHFGEFSLRCVGAHAYSIGDALDGEGSSVHLFCIYRPQQENGGLIAYRSRLFNLTRAQRYAYRNERTSPVLPRGPDPLIEIVRACDRFYELTAGGGTVRMIVLDYYVFFTVGGTAREAFSRAHGRLDG